MPSSALSFLPRRRPRGERGQTVVEFALVLPLLLLLVIGIANVASAFNWWSNVNELAASGARMAAVNKTTLSVTSNGVTQTLPLCNALKAEAGVDNSKLASTMTVTFTYPSGTQAGNPVQVDVTGTFPWMSFLPNFLKRSFSSTLKGSATMRLEQASTLSTTSC